MAGSLDYFVEKFLMVKWVWDRVALKPSSTPCWFGWLILAVWPLMVLIGITTQWTITGRGIHHQECKWTPCGSFILFYSFISKCSPLLCHSVLYSSCHVKICVLFQLIINEQSYFPSVRSYYFTSFTHYYFKARKEKQEAREKHVIPYQEIENLHVKRTELLCDFINDC
jgi:hypothetical protein